MIEEPLQTREEQLKSLTKTVTKAADFFITVDDNLYDGFQTAREVLSHLVFWHQEYVTIIRAILSDQNPELKQGTFDELNAAAACQFERNSMGQMSRQLVLLQKSLVKLLFDLPEWSITFPVKQGGRRKSVTERVPAIESHVANHLKRLRRAKRLGIEWVQAYYPDQITEGGGP